MVTVENLTSSLPHTSHNDKFPSDHIEMSISSILLLLIVAVAELLLNVCSGINELNVLYCVHGIYWLLCED